MDQLPSTGCLGTGMSSKGGESNNSSASGGNNNPPGPLTHIPPVDLDLKAIVRVLLALESWVLGGLHTLQPVS